MSMVIATVCHPCAIATFTCTGGKIRALTGKYRDLSQSADLQCRVYKYTSAEDQERFQRVINKIEDAVVIPSPVMKALQDKLITPPPPEATAIVPAEPRLQMSLHRARSSDSVSAPSEAPQSETDRIVMASVQVDEDLSYAYVCRCIDI